VAEQSASFWGRYELLLELGRGTTGVVYKAREDILNRVVALKMPLLASPSEAQVRVARFHREARVLARLTSTPDPNFPELHLVGEYQGQPFYVREFVEGNTLEQMARAGSLTLRQGITVLAAVARAIARIHAQGIAHRNLHPANVLIAVDGTPKLIGFGQVGFLAGSDMLPPGESGASAEVEVRWLQELLRWLCVALQQPVPAGLEWVMAPGSATTASAFAEDLSSYLKGGPV
jgi:serine/threonine protein kinase